MSFSLFFHESTSPPTLTLTSTLATTLKIGLYRISVFRTSYRTTTIRRSYAYHHPPGIHSGMYTTNRTATPEQDAHGRYADRISQY